MNTGIGEESLAAAKHQELDVDLAKLQIDGRVRLPTGLSLRR